MASLHQARHGLQHQRTSKINTATQHQRSKETQTRHQIPCRHNNIQVQHSTHHQTHNTRLDTNRSQHLCWFRLGWMSSNTKEHIRIHHPISWNNDPFWIKNSGSSGIITSRSRVLCTSSGQELRQDSTSETSYWKHSAIERSTSRYTQTAQPASPWQQDKEYQREQNTSNWNSCSSNNWCKTASLAYTRYHQWTTWQTSWPSTQQEKFYIGFSTVLVSTNTNKQQATASKQTRVSPVCM